MMKFRFVFGVATLAIVAALLAMEVLTRLFGLTDFPVYATDPEIKYIVKPDQSGAFLGTRDWCFNKMSMPVCTQYQPNAHPNVLLIGNSIIMGGNSLRQNDKLTPVLQHDLGARVTVWPAATGGWTNVNEMVYLDRHRDIIANADGFAWEYMAGGLSGATPWAGEDVFPTARPLCALCYVFERYVTPRLFSWDVSSELPVTGAAVEEQVIDFDRHLAQMSKRPGVIWLYPTAPQLLEARRGREWLPEREAVVAVAKKYGIKVVDIAGRPEWRVEYYRDGVHPGVEGTKVLAAILREEIEAMRL